MAELTFLGHIRTCMSTGFFINSDGALPATPIMSSRTMLQFHQVTHPKLLGRACMLVTKDTDSKQYVLEVTDETDSCYPNCRIVKLKRWSFPNELKDGVSLPSTIPDSMLFYISMVDDCRNECFIESKSYWRSVLDVYTANPREGTRVVCHPNWNDRRPNQVFILDKRPKQAC